MRASRRFLTAGLALVFGNAVAAGATNSPYPPAGRGASLLPATYLKTAGSQIVDLDGNPVRIAAVGWAGSDSAGGALQGLWRVGYDVVLDSIKADGFNAVRIPWIDAGLYAPVPQSAPSGAPYVDYGRGRNGELRGLNTLQAFERIVAYAGKIGLKIIFDHHSNEGWTAANYNGLWFDLEPGYIATEGSHDASGAPRIGKTTQAAFFDNWLAIAKTFAGNPTVIGYDLDNEPNGFGDASPHANISWGAGDRVDGLRVNDLKAMYQTLGNLIQAIDPGPLIICEGPQFYRPPPPGLGFDPAVIAPEGDLTGVLRDPVVLGVANKVVYSVHEYPNSIAAFAPKTGETPPELHDYGPGAVARMNKAWGFLVSQNIAPVFVGEMGATMSDAQAQRWAATLVSYLNGEQGALGGPRFSGAEQPVSATWWSAGRNDGVPNGTQSDWGVGFYRPEVQAITDRLLFKPSKPPSP